MGKLDTSELSNWLWDAASQIRGPVEAVKYKDYILPLIFIKRLSDVFDDEMEKLIEQFGHEETMEEERLPEPEFEEQGNGFVAKLFGDYKIIAQTEWQIKLNDRQKKILDFAQQQDTFKMADIEKLFSEVGIRTLRRDLNELVQAGIFEAKGKKRGRTYSLK